MFHGYHATMVMDEHRRQVRAVTEHAHRHTDDAGRIVRRARRPWWRRRDRATRVQPRPLAELAPSTR